MYKKFSDTELIEAYETMMNYSGEISDDILNEINSRGGLEVFKKKIERKNILLLEEKRISKEIYSLTSEETNIEFIKKIVTSDILSQSDLNDLVESKFLYYKAFKENRSINSGTYIVSLAGTIAAIIIGGIFLSLAIIFITPVSIYFIVPTYVVDYLIIRLITKKTRSNLVVFLATFLATIGSVFLGLYLASLFLPGS